MQVWIHGEKQNMKTEEKLGSTENSLLSVHQEGKAWKGAAGDDLGLKLGWLEAS